MKSSGRVFPMTPQNAFLVVQDASERAGLGKLAPHDLRRTVARLSRDAGAPLEQIQQLLGHASVQTTERYLGTRLELRAGKAAFDYVQLPHAHDPEPEK